MSESFSCADERSQLGLLLRVKARSLFNRVRQTALDAPVRVSAGVILIGVVWMGLYFLFYAVFWQFKQTPLEATVALPMVFNFFFMAMLVMLMFSNAIVSYGSLFSRSESIYLRAAPLRALDIVTLRYLESLVMASWSLVVLGLPLMMAMARTESSIQPIFYLLFICFFLAFIPIPGSLGLLLAWLAARYFPKQTTRWITVLVCLAALIFMVWGLRNLAIRTTEVEIWLRSFLARMSFIEAAFLPNHWVSAGIDHTLNDQLDKALCYLGVTIANAFFLSWVIVRFVAKRLDQACDRVSTGRGGLPRSASAGLGGVISWPFAYLPKPLQLIATKDLRTFLRDPLQWAQLVILFGLMILYLTNMPTLRLQFSTPGWLLIIPFLNLCAISLILATFTCRFVFPLVSLEGYQLWFIGLLPMPRSRVLIAKFAFAMTVTLLVGVGAMIWASVMLEQPFAWALVHVMVTASICFTLCGLAVGIGARLPMFGQTNTARIANGIGGTTNLLASLAMVSIMLTGVGYATWRVREANVDAPPDMISLAICASAAAFGIGTGLISLWVGGRHFNRVEV